MALISFSEVSRFYGRQDILRGATLSISPGDRVGLVGRNGAGKTTIIRLIMDMETPDSGQVTRARGLHLGYLPQDLLERHNLTLLELVMDMTEEFRRVKTELKLVDEDLVVQSAAGAPAKELMELADRHGYLLHVFESLGGWEKEAEAKKILTGLGFTERDFDRDLSEFSGGWTMRGALARLLLASPDLLVLDEPTNHLDLDSLIWLEDYLKSSSSALLLVSHDRIFLNNVVQKIIEVRQGRTHTYNGNYEQFLAEKEQRLNTEVAAFENQQGRIRQIEKFIEKNRVRSSTARRARSRIKMLEKMDRLPIPENNEDQSFNLRLPVGERGPDRVAEFTGVTKRYGETVVYRDLNFILKRGDRIALIGPNGRGKSTLLKMLAGLEPVTSGIRRLGQGVRIGYFAQFQLDGLNPAHSVIEELATVTSDLGQGALRSVLGGFLFSGEDVFKKVAILSGGEKARLALAKIMLTSPNLLLLDEPTNHLDIPSRQMLEDALSDYRGTLVLISHDRHFVNSLCQNVGTVEAGHFSTFPGNYNDYLNLWTDQTPKPISPKNPTPNGAATRGTIDKGSATRKETRKLTAQARKELANRRRPYQKKVVDVETRLKEINTRRQELENLLAAPATYQIAKQVYALNLEVSTLAVEVKNLEHQWEEAMKTLESL
ncbi:MAG: hypothetical protein AMR96_04250 [Candidatus Adiutrix intracellularis]|nr:MAG: hypothetical protein AMR96_04250 [Candidatus Adiutrix intracellularis]